MLVMRSIALSSSLVLLIGCRPATSPSTSPNRALLPALVVPAPLSLTENSGEPFTIAATTSVVVDSGNAEVARTAEMLAALLRASTGFPVPVTSASGSPSSIVLRLSNRASLDAEGYELVATRDSVRITAAQPVGLFRGVQTLRQLLPPAIESHMAISPMSWTVRATTITDRPRFAWRGTMLDVSRHFFTVREVKQYIDLLALYKMNVLHLHLSDDQGWRIEIKSRPKLATVGSATQVGGGAGGYYTQDDYAELVRYAQEHYVTIVPEIDMPSHTNAALAAYPELSCSRRPPALYTGTDVGWSTFCVDKSETYALVEDVVREIAAMTPGPYFHMGGDENQILNHEEYTRFVERVQEIVDRHGKHMIGWEEIARARLSPTTVAQAWATDSVAALALKFGAKVIMSPARRTYLDMKYSESTELGLKWAALIEVRDAYEWDPATYMKGVGESDILGIEAPIWSETLRNMTAAEYLAMPRLPALAEVGWTPQAARSWESFRMRVASHAPRWNLLGVNYYRSPQIPW